MYFILGDCNLHRQKSLDIAAVFGDNNKVSTITKVNMEIGKSSKVFNITKDIINYTRNKKSVIVVNITRDNIIFIRNKKSVNLASTNTSYKLSAEVKEESNINISSVVNITDSKPSKLVTTTNNDNTTFLTLFTLILSKFGKYNSTLGRLGPRLG